MRFSGVLLILVVILAINAAPAKKKTIRVPFRVAGIERPTLRHSRASYSNGNATSALGQRDAPVMPMRSYRQALWIGTVTIGTPPQTFDMIIDTGGGDTWVSDLFCENCGDLPLYDGGRSSTFKDLFEEFYAQYIGGAFAQGTWTEDMFILGDDHMITTPFGRAKHIPDSFLVVAASGLLGLGFPVESSKPELPTLIESLLNQNLLNENVFSCRFVKDSDQQAGEILFGGVETQYVDGDIKYTGVVRTNNEPDWVIPVDSVEIGGKPLGPVGNTYLDTGMTTNLLPDTLVQNLYSGIAGAEERPEGWFVTVPFPADVTFVVSGARFTIPAADMALTELGQWDGKYFGAIQVGPADLSILGLPFIKNNYLVFDFGHESIGIGKRRDY